MGRRLKADLFGSDRPHCRKVTVTLDSVALRNLVLIRDYYERRVDVGNSYDVSRCIRTALAHMARECAAAILTETKGDAQGEAKRTE